MKKFTRALTAALAAAVLCTCGVSAGDVSAFDPPDDDDYIGWEYYPDGWHYTYAEYFEDDEDEDGNLSETYLMERDGVLCVFDRATGYVKGKYTGRLGEWYSKDGLPYTGWTKTKSGKRSYFLEGYMVSEDFVVDGKLYGFDKNGVCTGEKPLPPVTAAAGKLTSDADSFVLTVTANDPNGGSYSVGGISKLERWDNGYNFWGWHDGGWVDCEAPIDEEDAVVLSGTPGECEPNTTKITLSPHMFTGGQLRTVWDGYYRASIPYTDLATGDKHTAYAFFRVLPPIETTVAEEVYVGGYDRSTEVSVTVKINSDKITPKDVKLEFYKKVAGGRNPYKKIKTADGKYKRKTVRRGGDTYVKFTGNFILDSGFYMASAVSGEVSSPAYFLAAVPAVYGKGDKNYYSIERDGFDFKLDLIIKNGLNKPLEIDANAFKLYIYDESVGKSGEYVPLTACGTDSGSVKKTVPPKENAELTIDLGTRYDLSELEAKGGYFLLTVDGLPYYFTVSVG